MLWRNATTIAGKSAFLLPPNALNTASGGLFTCKNIFYLTKLFFLLDLNSTSG